MPSDCHLYTVEAEVDTAWEDVVPSIPHHILQLGGEALRGWHEEDIWPLLGLPTWMSISLSLDTCEWSYSFSLPDSSQAAPRPTTRGVGTVPDMDAGVQDPIMSASTISNQSPLLAATILDGLHTMFILFTSTGILPTACSRVQCNLPAVSTSVQCSPTWAASVWKNTFLARHSRPIFSTGCGQANGKPGHEALSKQPPFVTNHHHVRYYLETAQIACLEDHKCTIDYPCSSSYPSVLPPGGFL